MASATTVIQAVPEQERPAPPSGDRRAVALAAPYYLLGALAVTLWLWRDPAGRPVAGNPSDAAALEEARGRFPRTSRRARSKSCQSFWR